MGQKSTIEWTGFDVESRDRVRQNQSRLPALLRRTHGKGLQQWDNRTT
jgi:hypothetical protein